MRINSKKKWKENAFPLEKCFIDYFVRNTSNFNVSVWKAPFSIPALTIFRRQAFVFSRVQFDKNLSSISGQTTVEYLLAIGVIAVAMAAVLLTGGLFEALADLFGQIATKIALPVP